MRIHSPIITGSLSISSNLVVSGSITGTSSFANTASLAQTSSYVLLSQTASFVVLSQTASFVLQSVSASVSSTASLSQTASSADTFIIRSGLTGSNALFTGGITAQTLTVQMVTSSIVYSSGSNRFGNQLTDVQQMTGSLRVTGSGDHYIVGGNVGIGTTTPFWKLDVIGNGRFTSDMTALNQVLTNTNSEGLRVYNSSGASLTEDAAVNSDSSYVYFTNFLKTRGLQIRQTTGNLNLIGGNVGIANANPTAKLHVSGSTNSESLFRVQSNIGTEAIFISSSGKVGIGTTTPQSLLDLGATTGQKLYTYYFDPADKAGFGIDVGGNSYEHSVMFAYGTSDQGRLTIGSISGSTFRTKMTISGSGNVGIGTTTPSNKLDVNGGTAGAATFRNVYNFAGDNYTIRIVGDTTKYGYISQYVNGGNLVLASGMRYYGAGPYTPDSTTAESIQLYNGDIYFTTNAGLTAGVNFTPSTRMFISSSGNVGIGTTSPAYNLDVKGTGYFDGPLYIGTVSNRNYIDRSAIRLTDSTSNVYVLDVNVSNTQALIQTNYYGGGSVIPLELRSYGNTNQLYLASNGNVGIGTTTPSSKLTIISTNATGSLRLEASASINALSIGGEGLVSVDSPGVPKGRFVILDNGNVGIGATTPAAKLDVNGDANISGSITTNGFILKGDPADANYNTRTRIIQDTFTISNAAAVNFDVDTLVSNALFTIEVSAMSYTGGTSYWEHGIGRGYLFPSGFGISYTSLSNSGLSVALSYQNSTTVRVALTDTVSATSKSAVIRITITAGYI